MMKQLCLCLLFITEVTICFGQSEFDKKSSWLNNKGGKVSEKKVFKACTDNQVVFFGEQHDDSLAHLAQLRLLKYLEKEIGSLCLGMEMFERDVQLVINEYMQDLIKEKNLLEESRAWSNYQTDYAPLVNFCKQSDIPVYATNIPRRYASSVFYHGLDILDSFSVEAKEYFPPKPYAADTSLYIYKSLLSMSMPGHQSVYLVEAQAIKDAVMAAKIASLTERYPLVYHINGNYHSRYQSGILHYLNIYAQEVKSISIQTIDSAEEIQKENLQADFYLLSP